MVDNLLACKWPTIAQDHACTFHHAGFSVFSNQIFTLKTKFEWLSSETYRHLKQTDVSVDIFCRVISSMKLSLKTLAAKYVQECFKKLATLKEIWDQLNQFWNFYNYELLQHVIRAMFTEADSPLLIKLFEYERDMNEFLSSTKVCDFLKAKPFSGYEPQENEVWKLKKFVMKVNINWDDCTLRDIKNISSTFVQGFFMPRKVVRLAGFNWKKAINYN